MKFLSLILFLASFSVFADTGVSCQLVNGIYQNSSNSLTELKFETVVDIFTLNNAKTLTFDLDGKNIRFIRSDITVNKQTKMIYLMKKKNNVIRAVHIMIDRTPKQVSTDKEFYGNMLISEEFNDEDTDLKSILYSKNLLYNFYCRF